MSYISPTQVNALAPPDSVLGTVSLAVTNANGMSSAFEVQIQRYSPGFFVFDRQGERYAAATLAGGAYLGPPGLLGSGLETRPAKPAEVITLYGTGFGPTNPSLHAAQVFSGAAALTDNVIITIGDVPAAVRFAGI